MHRPAQAPTVNTDRSISKPAPTVRLHNYTTCDTSGTPHPTLQHTLQTTLTLQITTLTNLVSIAGIRKWSFTQYLFSTTLERHNCLWSDVHSSMISVLSVNLRSFLLSQENQYTNHTKEQGLQQTDYRVFYRPACQGMAQELILTVCTDRVNLLPTVDRENGSRTEWKPV